MPPLGPPRTRDVRIDLARGLCLCFIFIDHMPGNSLALMTLHSVAVCDAADVFVFLCGVSAMLAYGRTLDRAGWWATIQRVLSRIRTIYIVHLMMLTVLITCLTTLQIPSAEENMHLGYPQIHEIGFKKLLKLALMLDQPGHASVLPLYIFFLLWFAMILPLVKRPLCLLALSGGLWIAVRAQLPGTDLASSFNLLAWQFPFILGVLCGRYAHLLRRQPLPSLSITASALLAGGLCASILLPNTRSAYEGLGLPLSTLLSGIDKRELDPGRILSVLALAWVVFRHVPHDAPWLRVRWLGPLISLGRHSLPVFAVGVVLSSLGGWALRALPGGLAVDVTVSGVGLCLLATTAKLSRVRLGAVAKSIGDAPGRSLTANHAA